MSCFVNLFQDILVFHEFDLHACGLLGYFFYERNIRERERPLAEDLMREQDILLATKNYIKANY